MSKSKWALLGIIIFILLIILLLPLILRMAINGPINDRIACCTLNVENVDINYPLMQIEVHNLKFLEHPKNNPEIRTTIEKVIVTLVGFELNDFYASLDLILMNPEVFYFDTGEESKDVEAESAPTYLPLAINSAEVKNGKVHFSHKAVKGRQAIDFHHVDIKVNNWSFRQKDAKTAKIYLTSSLEEDAKLVITGTLIPFKLADTMNVDYSLENLDMTNINQVLLNYIPVDITKGTLAIYGELDRNKKQDNGYIKVFLDDFDFIESDQDFKSAGHFAIEIAGAVVNKILKNKFTDNVAIKIPFKKVDGEIDYDKSEAFWSSIKNLFDSLERGVENEY